jgi:hypothetical protein
LQAECSKYWSYAIGFDSTALNDLAKSLDWHVNHLTKYPLYVWYTIISRVPFVPLAITSAYYCGFISIWA